MVRQQDQQGGRVREAQSGRKKAGRNAGGGEQERNEEARWRGKQCKFAESCKKAKA